MIKKTVFYLALGLVAAYCTAPLLWQLLTSLKPDWELTKLPPLLTRHPTGIHSVSMFPPIATISPLYLIIRALGLRDTLWALIITYTTFSLPLAIWILTNFFKEIPDEIFLAARVDGCSLIQSFYKIMLPLSAPGLFATAILVFIFSWNEFLFALTFTSTASSRTIPVAIALFPGLHEIPWGEIAAASVVVTVPLILLVFFFPRRIIEGLTAGAVKG